MIWASLIGFAKSPTGRNIGVIVVILLGAMAAVYYIQWTAGLKTQLHTEKQINRNLSKREQIDETVQKKSDYSVCIANGGLPDDCK